MRGPYGSFWLVTAFSRFSAWSSSRQRVTKQTARERCSFRVLSHLLLGHCRVTKLCPGWSALRTTACLVILVITRRVTRHVSDQADQPRARKEFFSFLVAVGVTKPEPSHGLIGTPFVEIGPAARELAAETRAGVAQPSARSAGCPEADRPDRPDRAPLIACQMRADEVWSGAGLQTAATGLLPRALPDRAARQPLEVVAAVGAGQTRDLGGRNVFGANGGSGCAGRSLTSIRRSRCRVIWAAPTEAVSRRVGPALVLDRFGRPACGAISGVYARDFRHAVDRHGGR